jgi:DNA-binding MarR family transcriptional regulator
MSKKPATPVPALAEQLHLLINQLVRRLRAAGASHELSWSQLAAMCRLESGPMTIAQLARVEAVKPQSMGATIRTLENTGFVRRNPHVTDKRQVMFSLTRLGRRVRADAGRAKRDWLAASMTEKLTPAERRTVSQALALLQRLVQA